jgi:3D (Asp-Asp-Asp) domain-containing protein
VDNSPAANASSIIAAIGIQGSQRLSLPTIDANLIWVTAYASVPNETDGNPFITADGQHVRDGIIAANWLPFGTQVKMPTLFGNKIFTVEDRMNQAFNQRADIWMPTVTDALDFGIRHIEVVIVNIPQQSQSS